MVLAAGLGTRFRPLSEVLAKPAAPVLNEPLIGRTLRQLSAYGVREALVNLHHRPDDVRRACAGIEGLRVRFQEEEILLGTGGGVKRAEPFFRKRTAIVWNGDMVFDVDLAAALAFHRKSRALATMVLRRMPRASRYGAVEIDRSGRVVRLLGEPSGRRGRPHMFTGVHFLEPGFFAALSAEPSCIVRTAYRRWVERGARIFGYVSDGRWLDIGTPADYLEANLALLAGRVLVGPGARVGGAARLEATVVGAEARVGAGASLSECVVWPGAVVAAGASVHREVIT
jgi:NDP-sugar pyrophosphorylase family protein